ncbi:substrate-binding domain-containing protein [Actinomadura violacea]|uniref:Substrate-binding domain-containing protein n=1 Tax=Actinomadura violacea TaxID=2819934 RepID=A0ABS3S8Z9_9ACTN|nr:substrate-binding domain-containing protein [Actinomadura violacea]MBO2465476.1 substrate-binding domain-containing protein [Actinomadura violacea]
MEHRVFLDLCQRRVDGLLVIPAGSDHSYMRAEMEMNIPVVFLDRPPVGVAADSVLVDNAGGARAGITELLARGHRRVGVITDSTAVHTARERLVGRAIRPDRGGHPLRRVAGLVGRLRPWRHAPCRRGHAGRLRSADGVLVRQQPHPIINGVLVI